MAVPFVLNVLPGPEQNQVTVYFDDFCELVITKSRGGMVSFQLVQGKQIMCYFVLRHPDMVGKPGIALGSGKNPAESAQTAHPYLAVASRDPRSSTSVAPFVPWLNRFRSGRVPASG